MSLTPNIKRQLDEAESARAHNVELEHWRWKAGRLRPSGCIVTQVGAKGFWFQRPGRATPEFMAWPVSEAAPGSQYGRVSHDV